MCSKVCKTRIKLDPAIFRDIVSYGVGIDIREEKQGRSNSEDEDEEESKNYHCHKGLYIYSLF